MSRKQPSRPAFDSTNINLSKGGTVCDFRFEEGD